LLASLTTSGGGTNRRAESPVRPAGAGVRINDQWRILFAFEKGQASGARIADYH
jgi:hypothetical protein